MAIPLNVLIVEDSEDDAILTRRELRQGGYDVTFERVETAADMAMALDKGQWDIILSDYSMPEFNAPAALKLVQERGLDIPFIIISGTVGEDTAVAAIKAGAHDFFPKQKLTLLIPAIQRELRDAAERRERHFMREQLHQSQERYRILFEHLPIGLYQSATGGQLLDANPALVTMLGYPTLEALLAVNVRDWAVTGHARRQWEALLSEYGVVQGFEARIQRYDGTTIWCILNARAVTNTQGMIEYYEGSVQNIDERKQAEEELSALYNAIAILFRADSVASLSNQIVEAVVKEFQQVDCGLMLVDQQQNRMVRLARAGDYGVGTELPLLLNGPGLVAEAVKTGRMVYAHNVAEMPDYIPSEPRTRSELVVPLLTTKGLLGVLDLQSPTVDAFRERDKRVLTAFAECAAAALETMQLYEEVNRYATELEWRVAERTVQLQQTKERVEAILNNSSDAIIVTGMDRKIQNANPAFSNMFGYRAEEMVNQPLNQLVEPDEMNRLDEAVQTILDGAPFTRVECRARRMDNTAFHADIVFSPVRHAGDQMAGIVCNVRDMTTRRQMEEELRGALAKEKELSELKSRFVSMVSHEFRTPLASILISAELLKFYGDRMSETKKQDHLTKQQNQVKHLTNLLEDVLTLGRGDQVGMDFRPTSVDLDALCRSLLEEVQQMSQAHQIQFTVSGDCQDALTDEKLLRHIVFNLLTNAVKYSPENEHVQFDLRCEAGWATLRIQDQGIGIPAEDQEHLFKAFHRAHNVGGISGTGLGLAIVSRAVEAHRGTITFESTIGEGTTFTVMLPIQ